MLIASAKVPPAEAVVRMCSVKKVFLEISENSQENTCARVSFIIKLQAFMKKEALAQVFSCEFFHRTPVVAASGEEIDRITANVSKSCKIPYKNNFL